ncbi:chemotaxis protein CheB [Deinococcus metallilatus]|uniref:histidine kinase n=1 Tax=Deinococcus metallilatus TaxID=1211322 RepID=A0ABR6MV01_9DEIO|nr:chemotaxis protein CheB [Deinococcus metallilatus]MBB5295777.1 PAS domain S-box-containing protein [Deinococcus metallilatus]GMA14306.1 hypothetical protein GCM10025871_06370 [Deinococcus metallilatus]
MSARPDSSAAPFDVLALLPPADGTGALPAVLADLPTDLPASVLIGPSLGREVPLVEFLRRHTPLPVDWAANGAVLQPGHVYVSPPRMLLEVRPSGRCAVTPPEGELRSERPLDRLLASLAVSFGPRVLVVILAGPGQGGVMGARALRGVGGTVLVGDPATADPAELLRAVAEAGVVDRVLPLGDLGRAIADLLAGRGLLPPGEAAKVSSESEGQAFLLALSDALRPLVDPVAVQGEACRLLAEQLDVDRAYYVEVDEAAGVARVARDWVRGGAPSLAGEHRISDFGWSVAILRRGEGHVIADTQTSDLVPPQDRPASAGLGIIACMGTPLIKKGRLVGALCVTASRPRVWQESEVKLLREVGERIWAAVERARAEDALRESEAKYRTLFDSIDEGFHIAELIHNEVGKAVDYHILEVNPAFERVTGFENAAGKLGSEISPNAESYWLETFDRVARTGEPQRIEAYNDDTQRWYLAYISRVGEAGSRQVASVFDDITERKRRELNTALLDEIGKKLSILSTPDEIIQTVGARLGEFLQVSGCILADVDEAKGETAIHYGWNTADVPSLRQTFRLADYFTEEFTRASRAGETVIVRNTARDERTNAEACARLQLGGFVTVPFHRHGRWTANITVTSREARDWRADEIQLLQEIASRVFPRIERARAEEALRVLNATLEERVEERTRRLADLNAELGTLITRTARNLEVPVGYLSRFLDPGRPVDLLVELPPHAPSALQDELARLRGVSQDLRQLARLEDQHLNRDLLPLGELFAEVRAAAAGSRAEWLIQPLPIVRGDRALLRQALEVLLTFTLSETRGARYVDVSSQEVEGEVWVTVQDDGIGLTGEEAATLFDLVVRTEQAVPLLPGSGLVQVRRILARHGGWAWAEARINGGRVVLAFPRDESVRELEALFRQDER